MDSVSRVSEIETILPVAREIEFRQVRKSPLPVVDYVPSAGDEGFFLAEPGALTVFLARKGSWVLDEVRRAAVDATGYDSELFQKLARYFDGRQSMPLAEAVDIVLQQPTFSSVRYQNKVLASSLFLPEDIPVVALALPYNGGAFDPAAFVLVEHLREDSDVEFEGLILRHSPELTEAEREALRLVPPDQDENNVGGIGMCFAACAIAVAALVCLATTLCCNAGRWRRTRPVDPRPGPDPGPVTPPGPGPRPGPGPDPNPDGPPVPFPGPKPGPDPVNPPGPKPGPGPDPLPDDPPVPNPDPNPGQVDPPTPRPNPLPDPPGPKKAHLTEQEMAILGPSASAREILRRRRAWLEAPLKE